MLGLCLLLHLCFLSFCKTSSINLVSWVSFTSLILPSHAFSSPFLLCLGQVWWLLCALFLACWLPIYLEHLAPLSIFSQVLLKVVFAFLLQYPFVSFPGCPWVLQALLGSLLGHAAFHYGNQRDAVPHRTGTEAPCQRLSAPTPN